MNWCRFQLGGRAAHGIAEGDQVTEVRGSPFTRHSKTTKRHALNDVNLLPPCMPLTLYAAGGINYRVHAQWASEYFGRSMPAAERCEIGYRAGNALIPSGATIVIPADSEGDVHYEGELVAVIGKQAKHLTRENALDCVLGFTVGNDVSERTWQTADRGLWRAKNSDTFKPMGPWITTGLDPTALEVITRINGREVSRYQTGGMVFSVVDHLVEGSKYMTFYPGDVLWMGCDGATGPMAPGDMVEVEIPGIGTLRNPVAAA